MSTVHTLPCRPTTRRLCEASYRAARMFATKHELRLNVASMAGLLMLATGDPMRAMALAEGSDDFMTQVRAYIRKAALEEQCPT